VQKAPHAWLTDGARAQPLFNMSIRPGYPPRVVPDDGPTGIYSNRRASFPGSAAPAAGAAKLFRIREIDFCFIQLVRECKLALDFSETQVY